MNALEKELVISFRNGNQKAFELIFKAYYKRLCSYAITFLHQKETTEDLVKDMFLRMWEKRGEFNITTSLSGYLFKSTRNACLNYLSREKEKNRLISDNEINLANLHVDQHSGHDYPVANLIEQELEVKIRGEVDKLPQQCKEIFKLSRFEDLSHRQIAKQLNISENTVKVQIYRALSKLRVALKPYLPILIIQAIAQL
ncbi:hypothetical protein MNBD_BACTEROID01-1170 [hydrothermal vent metagenome]|uniref:RNA polymerase ECF-type sigma factor n=1 Tax=hydrothermal vent metagenome TaxID=652676 RepID=A0A3B0UJB7_9ZZZZ